MGPKLIPREYGLAIDCVYYFKKLFIYLDEGRMCSRCSSVMGLTNSAPDTGLRVTPMIPPRNSLAVGGVATCTVIRKIHSLYSSFLI